MTFCTFFAERVIIFFIIMNEASCSIYCFLNVISIHSVYSADSLYYWKASVCVCNFVSVYWLQTALILVAALRI